MIDASTLEKIRLALRLTTTLFDNEIADLAEAAIKDLGIAGVNGENAALTDPLVLQAVITYCKMHFGEPDEYDRLKASYDEQKAQLSMATTYTIWASEV